MSTELILRAPKASLTVVLDTVSLQITCNSEYEAQVLFDDLARRLLAGQEISIAGRWSEGGTAPRKHEGGGT